MKFVTSFRSEMGECKDMLRTSMEELGVMLDSEVRDGVLYLRGAGGELFVPLDRINFHARVPEEEEE